PSMFGLLDDSILNISADIRKIALIIILTRAGLNLSIEDLKKVGRPAFLMCFVPACFEILGMVVLAPIFLGMNLLDSLILGSVIAAVSPAVVVPKMLKLMEEKTGTKKGIPQLIMAGASVDDVFVIALFTSFTSLASESSFTWNHLVNVPVSIITGILGGMLIGLLIAWILEKWDLNRMMKIILVLGCSLLMVSFEDISHLPFASLIGVMSMGAALQKKSEGNAYLLSKDYSKMWVIGEIFLFVLVGAVIDLQYALTLGWAPILLILSVLLFRMAGVFVCLLKTNLNMKERLFCMIAYCPKATVQAAIGSVPMAMGLACGQSVLTVAVVSILITAPLGALAIDKTYQKLL
uniref:cation:proton antiporter n=1 Tax=uncultured Traorella sp. TaxID=1929048 RepID=UPI0025EB4E0C